MKITTVFAVAVGLGALAACNQSPQEQAAENIEENADAAADTLEANADATAQNVEDAGENAADAAEANSN